MSSAGGMVVVYGALMRLHILHNVRYYQGVVERGTSDSSNTITLTMVTLSAAGVDIVPLNVGQLRPTCCRPAY